MMIQQYEKAKVIQDEQLERLTQICQEQGVKFSYVYLRIACHGKSNSSCTLLQAKV